MNEFNIQEQRAENIYQAEKIYLGPLPADHVQAGKKALMLHDYEATRAHFGRAIDGSPVEPETHYQLALALLDGQRPHMASAATIKSIQRQLALAEPLLEARALLVLVNEDYYLTWQQSNAVPPALVDLVQSIPLARAQEIIEHVPAEQCRVWRLLTARVKRGF